MISETKTSAPPPKLSNNDVIYQLTNAMHAGDKDRFYEVLESFAFHLPPSNKYKGAINRLIRNRPRTLKPLSMTVKNLIEQAEVAAELVFLDDLTGKLLKGLSDEYTDRECLIKRGIPVRNKMLFYGPTGNGKTTMAREISRILDVPFMQVHNERIIQSHIGQSGQNIKAVFDNIDFPCVLFWDEIDSIGSERAASDNAAGLENERMVNSLLVNMDKLSPSVMFVAATNRREVLDSALLRRFDEQYELPSPMPEAKQQFADSLIKHYEMTEFVGSRQFQSFYTDVENLPSLAEIKKAFFVTARMLF